jgi:hypothetical protein
MMEPVSTRLSSYWKDDAILQEAEKQSCALSEADFGETWTSIEQDNESNIAASTQQHAVAIADSEDLFETLREECGSQLAMLVDSYGNHLVKFWKENESEIKLLRKLYRCTTMYHAHLQDIPIPDLNLASALVCLVT